ncbi:MAG: DNA recombination/repair protein RecA, partial [Deltaproteobacteria bacterium]
KVVKNKMAPPFKQVEFDILFGEGISKEGDIIDIALQYGVIDKSGSWFAFEGEKLGQGRENTRLFLKEHPDYADKIKKKVEVKAQKDGGAVLAANPVASNQEEDDSENGAQEATKAGKPASPVRTNSKKGE